MLSLNPETVKRIRANQNTLTTIKKLSSTPKETVSSLINAIGYYEAVETIATMINSIPDHWDGRISATNYEWAIENTATCAVGDPVRRSFVKSDDIHPAHLNQIADAMRKAEAPESPDRYEVRIFDEDGETIEEHAYNNAANAISVASLRVVEASEQNEAIRTIVVDTFTDNGLYEGQTLGTAYRIFEDYASEEDGDLVYSAEESAQAFADYLMDSAEGADAYNEMLDECNEMVTIGSLSYYPSVALERIDPVAYRCGKSDFADAEYSDCLYDLERLDYGETWGRYGLNIKLFHPVEERTNGSEWVRR